MSVSQSQRYVLQEKLGGGAMGEVWLANDTLLQRPVAIKYLRVTAPQYKELFVNEARRLAGLNHPNITAIYDAVFDERAGYSLVMEYVPGRALSEIIQERDALDVDAALDVAMGILRALQFAHQHGVVHRDIKPANVLIADEVKVTDFGLADLASRLRQGTGYMAGTPGYMPPEQIRGERTDARSDLYALGVTLFEMLTGTLPFDYDGPDDLLAAPIRQTPHAVRKFAPDAPLVLEHTIAKLLAPDPDDRYPSADVLLEVLGTIQARRTFDKPDLQLLDAYTTPFVDRANESKHLTTLWEQVRETGAPRLLVVRGEAGVGKSRLVAEFLGRVVDEGYAALVGRCNEFGEPYAPFAEILATVFKSRSTLSLTVADRAGHILSQIPSLAHVLDIHRSAIPDALAEPAPGAGLWAALSERVPGGAPGASLSERAQWKLYDTVLFALSELGPAVLFFEDGQHLDEASLALVRFLLRRGRIPALFIAACRDDEGPIPWHTSLLPNEMVELPLQPLSTAASRELAAQVLGGPVSGELAATVLRCSHGNPLYVTQAVRHLLDANDVCLGDDGEWCAARTLHDTVEPLPPALMELMTRRLDALSEDSRRALVVAAVIGLAFRFDVWVALLGGESEMSRALDVLDEALDQRVLRDIGNDCYAFYPAALADVLAASLAAPRRRYLEGRVAEILEAKS